MKTHFTNPTITDIFGGFILTYCLFLPLINSPLLRSCGLPPLYVIHAIRHNYYKYKTLV